MLWMAVTIGNLKIEERTGWALIYQRQSSNDTPQQTIMWWDLKARLVHWYDGLFTMNFTVTRTQAKHNKLEDDDHNRKMLHLCFSVFHLVLLMFVLLCMRSTNTGLGVIQQMYSVVVPLLWDWMSALCSWIRDFFESHLVPKIWYTTLPVEFFLSFQVAQSPTWEDYSVGSLTMTRTEIQRGTLEVHSDDMLKVYMNSSATDVTSNAFMTCSSHKYFLSLTTCVCDIDFFHDNGEDKVLWVKRGRILSWWQSVMISSNSSMRVDDQRTNFKINCEKTCKCGESQNDDCPAQCTRVCTALASKLKVVSNWVSTSNTVVYNMQNMSI
jgi:hypothetical protein